MFKTLKKAQKGFTIIELLIVIAIIAILALLVLNNFQGAQAKARDQQRTTDLNNIHGKLEEFYNENNHYPGTVTATSFPGMDEGSTADPIGSNQISSTIVADATAADNAAAPANDTTSSSSYAYIAYPTGCDATTPVSCTGYRLKTFIEKPSTTTPNPFVKKSLN
jgi:prepilin-type N-terminal cleavage/methylation domain-containing protein